MYVFRSLFLGDNLTQSCVFSSDTNIAAFNLAVAVNTSQICTLYIAVHMLDHR